MADFSCMNPIHQSYQLKWKTSFLIYYRFFIPQTKTNKFYQMVSVEFINSLCAFNYTRLTRKLANCLNSFFLSAIIWWYQDMVAVWCTVCYRRIPLHRKKTLSHLSRICSSTSRSSLISSQEIISHTHIHTYVNIPGKAVLGINRSICQVKST